MTVRHTWIAVVATATAAFLLATPDALAFAPAAVSGPVASADAAAAVAGSPVVVDVLANDTYAAPATVSVAPDAPVAPPAHGTVAVTSVVVEDATRAAVSYTPDADWSGSDTFGYSVTDASGLAAVAVVAVTAAPVSTPGHSVTLTATSSVVVLHRISMSGAVAPADASPVVRIQTLRATGWGTFATVTPAADGSYSYAWNSTAPGAIRWRAVVTWTDAAVARSTTVVSTVVASADPVVSGRLPRSAVPYSYRAGCPVAPASLRRLTVNYYDYAGRVRRGDVILHASAVSTVRYVFLTMFAKKFRVKLMVPVDYYYRRGRVSPTGSDIGAMNAGNTSAFNCRKVTGSRYRISQHSYGNAIDVNTYENPYATSSRIYPAAAAYRYYTMRRYHLRDQGVIAPASLVARAFASRHWLWGARWSRHDYQHFSANGG
jgi:hypothetical protein